MNKAAEEILDIYTEENSWVLSPTLIQDIIIPSMKKYSELQYNEAIRDIQKEYETNKDFNITSILKYLK